MYDIPFDKTIQNVVTLQAHTSAYVDTEKKKLVFLTSVGTFTAKAVFHEYCFAVQSYPKCNYEQLRDFLVLPCKRKLQYITSSIDKDQVLRETFDKVQTLQQKNVFLLVDEVQIRLTVSISGGLLSGMAENMSILSILTKTLTLFAVNPSNLLSTPQRKTSRKMQSFRPLSRWPGWLTNRCSLLGRLVSESACERKDPGSNPAADMVDAARNTVWDLGKTTE
ncbi:hypothetical protein FHG87_016430 [Trinorchestia longiramus]|nr:hypothetical protein FHG87_016430 [Trinorchestia longiramus]